MALSTGIAAQKSRFAILDIESESASSGDEWQQVRNIHGEAPHHKNRSGHQGPPPADKPMSKSAKKRARKRRNRNSSSEVSLANESCIASVDE